MESSVNPLQKLFSRGSSPPAQPQPQIHQPLSRNPSPNQIDSLFHNLTAPSDHQVQSATQLPNNYGSSASVTSLLSSLTDEPIAPSISSTTTSATNADRQSALLSLLGGGPVPLNPRGLPPPAAVAGPSQPQQVPTPPGSSQRSHNGSTPTHQEVQGKYLLEQLMAGNPPRSNYTEDTHSAPSPPYAPSIREGDYRPYNQSPSEGTQRTQGQGPQPSQPSQQQQQQPQQQQQQLPVPPPPLQQPQQIPQQPRQQPQQQQQQSPSPRKSMFDFDSPFDHLSTSTSTIKKKPIPPQPPSASSGNEDSGSWTAVSDPKRQSVENLLDHLSRGQSVHSQPPPPHQLPPQPQPTYEAFNFSHAENLSNRVPPPPLPPKPTRAASPRASPPRTHAQRAQGRSVESPASQHGAPASHSGGNKRDKESSPIPRGGGRGKGPPQPKFSKNQSNPSTPLPQTVIFDVSQPLEEIQAPHDSVKSTAIALVKQDSVFLPGSTIGATHWVAYAMTRGRVRVISRSSGDRTLLQLPPIFPNSSSVVDMAVHGNRLAGVTSDGGFIVWELPLVITDNVPGQVLLCVQPSQQDDLHAVKWHPKDPDTLAIASEHKVYIVDLQAIHPQQRGQPVSQSNLHHISTVVDVPSPVASFDFDVPRGSLMTISNDATLIDWNINEQLPFSTHKIRGDDLPSSLTFVDGGIVIGRKKGTIFQLLSITTKQVLSTIKFVTNQDDTDMFGHASYDSRIQTLWIANCRRESLIAFRINLESTVVNGEEAIRGGFDQVVEFAGPKPTIHFVILTADADPSGDEAHAACVAAKVPPGELALVAFSVHSSGVDQVLVRKEWFDTALATSLSKLPYDAPQAPSEVKGQRQVSQVLQNVPVQHAPSHAPPRARSPGSEDGDFNRDDPKAGKGKGKVVNWKEKDDQNKDKDKNGRMDALIINDSSLGQALSREIKRTEESLHTRIGRLIGKEMDKQHQRMEDARAHEQAEDFARQEKILKLISTELTRNTTRVVEMAVKSEVQNSVLPSLEIITKNEVKAALNDQIGRGLVDYISQSLPGELEKLLFRADVSSHFAHVLSTNLTPLLGGHVHEAMAKTFVPLYNQQMNRMHQELSQELRHEIHGLKAELISWQRDLFRNQETSIRELEHTVRTLSDHIKFLSINPAAHLQQPQTRNSPGAVIPVVQGSINQMHPRQQNPPIAPQGPTSYHHKIGTLQQQLQSQPQQAPQPPPPQVHQQWYSSGIAAPQASHPATIPQPPPPPPPSQAQPQPKQQPELKNSPAANDTWESIFLPAVLSEDLRDLQVLLSRMNADVVMPLDRAGPLSQPVILTAMHRLAALVCASPPNDESFTNAMWWLQRGITVLDPKEQIVVDYLPNVVPGIYTHLNMTKQRLGLPGGPPSLEKARASVLEALAMLRRKGLQGYEGMEIPKK
ncbi:hypothetical protein DXG03_005045 [Asterophora parasitica]|uniref:Uncharacterized protein n=1 Tax=Asterophora parasitica TaxID=117018 RepID=A0A9P7KCT5_9AGAR|nr:hypothetical protein DXG03_005045 [Asterophora parasitica]